MRTRREKNPRQTGRFGVFLKDQTWLPPVCVSLLLFSLCVVVSFLLCFILLMSKCKIHITFLKKKKKKSNEVITIRWKVTLSKQYSSYSWTFLKTPGHEHFKHNMCHRWILHFLPQTFPFTCFLLSLHNLCAHFSFYFLFMVWLFIPVIIYIKTLKNSDVLHKSKEDGQSGFCLWSQIFINEDEGLIHLENSQKKYALARVCPCRAGETLELFVLIMWCLSFKVRDIKVFVVEALKDLLVADSSTQAVKVQVELMTLTMTLKMKQTVVSWTTPVPLLLHHVKLPAV